MPKATHFEIHASDPKRAITFYEQVLGWKFAKWEGEEEYWLFMAGEEDEPGISGGLMPRRGPEPVEGQPVNSFVTTIGVTDLDHTLESGVEHGGTIAMPKMPVPGVGWMAYLKDTEGNIFGIMQPDPTVGIG